MIKGILLAAGMSLVYLGAVTILFRVFVPRARAAAMTGLFLLTVPFFLSCHWLTPPNLGFLPGEWAEPNHLVDLGFGLLLYGAAFFGGILQVYNLADRGFSLRIVMDIEESPRRALSLDEVLRRYGGGKGIGWMYQKRLDGLVEHHFGHLENGWISNRQKGKRAAGIFGWLRQFLRMD